jgi:hypothetical protein
MATNPDNEIMLSSGGANLPMGKGPSILVTVGRSFSLGSVVQDVASTVTLPEVLVRQWLKTGRVVL